MDAEQTATTKLTPPLPRQTGGWNRIGLLTLIKRGHLRFLKLFWETLGGPCVSGLMFFAVFVLAGGWNRPMAGDLDLASFLVPGIVGFMLGHLAFEGGAFPILEDKLEGMMGDLLAAPLSPLEILAGYIVAAMLNALVVGCAVLALLLLFVDLPFALPSVAVGFAILNAVLFAQVGVLSGLWADRWEHYSAAETFLVLPLGFLSGAFFSVSEVPLLMAYLVQANPIFYAIDGLRYGLTGHGESNLLLGALYLIGLNLALGILAWRLFAVGYKIKA